MKGWFTLVVVDAGRIVSNNPLLSALGAIALSTFGLLYGSDTVTKYGMTLLCILVTIDWLSGFSAAKKDGIETSSYGIEGIVRTVVLLLMPAAANYVDLFFQSFGLVSFFVIAALSRHILKSSIANIIRCGWAKWFPVDALETVTEWVAQEIDHKKARAEKRFKEMHGKGGEE